MCVCVRERESVCVCMCVCECRVWGPVAAPAFSRSVIYPYGCLCRPCDVGPSVYLKRLGSWRVCCECPHPLLMRGQLAPLAHALHSQTLYLKPSTLNPEPRAPNPKPQTPNPKLQTPNPKPQTPNPKPQPPNPKTQTRTIKLLMLRYRSPSFEPCTLNPPI